jgi:hypothetical protein
MTGLGKKEEEENKIKHTPAPCITDIMCRSYERQLRDCLVFACCVTVFEFLFSWGYGKRLSNE